MKLPIRILTALLCAAIILFMPFVLSSPQILDNEKARLMQDDAEEDEAEDGDSEEIDFGRLLFPSAYAEGGEDSPETSEEVSHISYYNVEKDGLDLLIQALDDLVELSSYFYEDETISSPYIVPLT